MLTVLDDNHCFTTHCPSATQSYCKRKK